MIEQDISGLMQVADTSPENAAKNIDIADRLGTSPDQVNEMSDTLYAMVDAQDAPSSASPRVAGLSAKSTQHASIMKSTTPVEYQGKEEQVADAQRLSTDETLWHYAKTAFDRNDVMRRLGQIGYQKASGQTLTDDEELNYSNLKLERNQLNAGGEGGHQFWQTAGVQALSGAWDYGKGLMDNYEKIVGVTAAGALGLGAVGGLLAGPPGAVAGALHGGRAAFTYGVLAAGASDAFKQSTGHIYVDLSENSSIPEDQKRIIANGGGALMGLASTLAAVGVAKTMPWVSKTFSPAAFSRYLLAAENAPVLSLAKSLGRSGLIGALGAASSDAIKIVTEEIGKAWDGNSRESVINGLQNAVNHWDEHTGRLAKSATVGALTAATATAAGHALEGGTQMLGERVAGQPEPNLSDLRDVTPQELPRLNPGQTASEAPKPPPGPVTPQAPRPATDIVGENPAIPTTLRGTRALELQIALAQSSHVTKNSNLKNLAPKELNDLRRQVLDDAGVPYVWVDKEDLSKWANSDEKAAKVRKILDSTGVAASQLNAPIRIPTHDFLDVVDDHPEVSGLAKLAPEEMSADQYVAHFDAMEARRQEILKNLPTSEIVDQVTQFDGEKYLTPDAEEKIARLKATKEELHHGTVRKFEAFSPDAEKIYGERKGGYWFAYEPPLAVDHMNAAGEKQAANTLADDSNLTPDNIGEKFPKAMPEGQTFTAPVYGESLDLTNPWRWPKELVEQLKNSIDPVDQRMYEELNSFKGKYGRRFQDAKAENAGAFALSIPEAFISNSYALRHYAAKHGIGKIVNNHGWMPSDGKAQTKEIFDSPEEMRKHLAVFVPNESWIGRHNDVVMNKTEHLLTPEYKDFLQKVKDGAHVSPARMVDEDITNEQDYLNQPTFTKPIEGVVSEKEVAKFNEAQKQARLGVIEAIDDAAAKDMNKTIDLVTELKMQEQYERAADAIRNHPFIDVVENFMTNKIVGDLTPEMEARRQKGQPIYAIDPKSLPDAIRNRFIDDVALKSRKVFAKDGVPWQVAADAMGEPNLQTLLEILSSVPRKSEAIERAAEMRRPVIEQEAQDHIHLDETKIAKAYSNMAKNHLKEMKFLRSKEWPALKQGIKRIALPLPRMSELVIKAQDIVAQTAVKSLNVNQWKVGERRSQRNAIDAILKNQVERAFTQKQSAAQNALLARETHLAIGKLNRATKMIARLTRPEVQAELKEASKTGVYLNAVNEILDVYNFDPSMKKQSKVDSYRKFAEKMVHEGNGDFKIPDEVQSWLTGKTSAKELSVEQYLYLADKMKSVLKQARLKGQIIRKYQEQERIETTEMLAEAVHELALKHPDYKPDRAVTGQGQVSVGEKIAKWIRAADNTVKNIEFIAMELDKGVVSGPWSELLYHRLKGIGKFTDTGLGETAATSLREQVKKNHLKHIKAFGETKFNRLGIQKVFVPEFESAAGLRKGNLTKLDLLEMLKHMGNEENRTRFENFGISAETAMKVLERELPVEAFDYVQNGVWNLFKSFKPRIAGNELATTGVDIEFTEPQGFSAHGKEFEGGHYPARYKRDTTPDAIRKKNEALLDASVDGILDAVPKVSYEGVVRSPHTKERTGSQWELDLAPEIFARTVEEVLYDLTMRIPVRDTMNFLRDRSVSHDIQAIVGPEKYDTLLSAVAESTRSVYAENIALYGENQKFVRAAFAAVDGAIAIGHISYVLSTVLVQPSAMIRVVNKMGVQSGSKHIALAALKILHPTNIRHLGEVYKFAAEFDSSIGNYRAGIDDHTANALLQYMPKKRLLPGTTYHLIKNFQEASTHVAMSGIIGSAHIAQKVVTFVAGYNQFMSGEAPGHAMEKVAQMSEAERHAAAGAYGAELSSTSLWAGTSIDRSALQKTYPMRLFTRFWNDGRNALNSNIQTTRNARYSLQEGIAKARAGDTHGASEAIHDAGSTGMKMMFLAMLGILFQGWARGHNPLKTDDDDRGEDLTFSQNMNRLPGFLMTRPTTVGGQGEMFNQIFGEHIPVLRDIIWGAEYTFSKNGTKTAGPPITQAMGDMATALAAPMQIYLGVQDGVSLAEQMEMVNEKQWKAGFTVLSLMTGGIPVNAGFKLYDYIRDKGERGEPILPIANVLAGMTVKALDKFIDHNQTKSEANMSDEEIFAQINQPKTEIHQAVDQARTLKDQITPPAPGEALSHDGYQIIKYTESGGKWNARPPEGGAFGLYQFLPSTWKFIASMAPELNLSRNGRTSRNPEQQEKAAHWYMEHNASVLRSNNLPVNIETLYGAWHFGASGYTDILQAKSSARTKDLLSEKALNDNPWIMEKGYTTAGKLKQYIRDRLTQGRQLYENSVQVTRD